MNETAFYVAEQLRAAASDGERAAMLLRLPDELLFQRVAQLVTALSDAGFHAGVRYLVVRFAGATAVRLKDGTMPPNVVEEIEACRKAMCELVEETR